MLLQFPKSQVQNQFHWTKVKMSAGMAPSGGREERIHFLAFFRVWWPPVLLGLWPLLPSSEHVAPGSVSIITSLCPLALTVPESSYEDHCS